MQFWALIFVHFHTSMSSRILAATFIFSVLSPTFFKFISNILKYFIVISISNSEKWNNLSVKVCRASLFSYISFSELIFLIYLLLYLWYFDISLDNSFWPLIYPCFLIVDFIAENMFPGLPRDMEHYSCWQFKMSFNKARNLFQIIFKLVYKCKFEIYIIEWYNY